ncbi:MAG: hypothetical protein ACREFX_08110, partial [Opitutaceae bacterium]
YGQTSGYLADPMLTVYSTSVTPNVVVAANSGWGDDPQIATVAHAVDAFALNSGSKDAVVLLTLPPGSYTAQATSANAGSGVVLVEVYEVK